MEKTMQNEITRPGDLLDKDGNLAQVGWSRFPILDPNLERMAFYHKLIRPLQFARTKRWDYYAVFTPQRFFSATIADLGYAGNIFVYIMDFASGDLHEEGLVIPLSRGILLPRDSTQGETSFANRKVRLSFKVSPGRRALSVSWPGFHDGRGVYADISLACPPEHESMTIVIPIPEKRFYYNRKINCMPAQGTLRYGSIQEEIRPESSLGQLDWGRGAWAYRSFWNWASASGFLADGRAVGLNLGCGFGDTSAASEDCMILEGRVSKLGRVRFEYDSANYLAPWRFSDDGGRLELVFTPFKERLARTDLKIIFSEVHQMFGHYQGYVIADSGERVQIERLVGFAEEHHARW
jgi:hypothetical protein